VLDLLMPGIDGFVFISRFRSLAACGGVPVVVWTVKDLDPEERQHLRASTAAVVFKREGGSQALLNEMRRLLPAIPPAQSVYGV
jgi:CheY-like chemotaxis protein